MKKEEFKKIFHQIKEKIKKDRRIVISAVALALILTFYFFSLLKEKKVYVFKKSSSLSFSGGRILDNGRGIYKRKEELYSKKLKNINSRVNLLDEKMKILIKSVNDLSNVVKNKNEEQKKIDSDDKKEPPPQSTKQTDTSSQYQYIDSVPNNLEALNVSPTKMKILKNQKRMFKKSKGLQVISFPVQMKSKKDRLSLKLPAGSFVKAKLLTGIQAPEGRPLPVLLQADYAFIGPNKSHVDLSGCFLIGKSTGNLSIERVEMQTQKISCVAKSGKMFERKMNGFVTDGKDNSFAVAGRVKSKQNRVAMMSFLASIVEGIGKAIQQAQTTTNSNALGGINSTITGNQGKYIAAGGASNSASQVSQWYLKHAQNLLPTIQVGSGKDVWIVTQDTVNLPNWYFQKKKGVKNTYHYLSRMYEK